MKKSRSIRCERIRTQAVFRHPDHLPDAQTLQSSFTSSLQNLSLNASTASKLGGDALKALYGVKNDIVLYWAHHEKLCIVDSEIVFMGGLDLCYVSSLFYRLLALAD